MHKVSTILLSIVLFVLLTSVFYAKNKSTPILTVDKTQKELLGKLIFNDANYSSPNGVSCATCHSPNTAFSDPRHAAFSEGVLGILGNRNAPSIMYMCFTPRYAYNKEEDMYVGGFFWDGRANTLNDQILGPFFNPDEMNCANKTAMQNVLENSNYLNLYQSIYGNYELNDTIAIADNMVDAIVSFLRAEALNPFTSKYDYYLKGMVELTAQEKLGLEVFNNVEKGNCAACHPSTPDENNGKVLFTDYTYDNLGIAPHALNKNVVDEGLMKTSKRLADKGKFKVPTLRNIELTAPYFHNGSLNTLEEVVDFYADRDTGKFGTPEVAENVNTDELGALDLNKTERKALVAFLKTLTDGYKMEQGLITKY